MSAHDYNRQRTPRPFHLYRVYNRRGVLLYVGITTDVARRSREHGWGRGPGWQRAATRVESEPIGPQVLARAAEAAVIRDEQPRYNDCLPVPARAESRLREYMRAEGLSMDGLVEKTEAETGEPVSAWVSSLIDVAYAGVDRYEEWREAWPDDAA